MKALCIATLTLAPALLGLAVSRVSADPVDETRSLVVGYADLDLSRTDATHALYERFKHAAREVCKTRDGAYGNAGVWLHCYHDALARGVRDLNNPGLTALYLRENPKEATATRQSLASDGLRARQPAER